MKIGVCFTAPGDGTVDLAGGAIGFPESTLMTEWSNIGFWLLASLLMLINAGSLVLNLLLLPGNWLMVFTLLAWLLGTNFGHGPTWTVLVISIAMAGLGELLELMLGSAKAAKKGASRRAMALSLVLSFLCSVGGTFLIPIPLVGSVIGAIIGAAAGAFGGAWLGEAWKGTETAKRNEIGSAAMSGRLIGMSAKFVIGAAIFVIQLVSIFMG